VDEGREETGVFTFSIEGISEEGVSGIRVQPARTARERRREKTTFSFIIQPSFLKNNYLIHRNIS
jgi:hypothetical protein